ncbi:hypothetical protein Lesp02_58900 [Lentzea sp. NBRC 105346]|nr:hypothetical protein [Lentzea sp. NBRC 105346]GLZ33702.1 hypothetical protein Lesp02_58900 [Lentzea sp. NBRC 105346]
MTTPQENVRPGGAGLWAPVVPEQRDSQEWVSQEDEDELIVKSVD